MGDLVKQICEKTGISEEDSTTAVKLVLDFLDSNLTSECKKKINELFGKGYGTSYGKDYGNS
ncbi:MAG: hypothetical protein KDD00_10235 [Ignavibacteriae bacterium]|nr:hypothetical protein [Ignavibacteriota bacterium]